MGERLVLLRWLIAPERATPATWWPPSVRIFLHKKWQLKDGKHREEPAEVGLASGQGKSEAVLEAFGGGGCSRPDYEGPRGITSPRYAGSAPQEVAGSLPDASHQDKSMFPTCPALMECFINISIC